MNEWMDEWMLNKLSPMGLFRDNEPIIQTKYNMAKNPNWQEANRLAIYKRGWGFELGTTENKSS